VRFIHTADIHLGKPFGRFDADTQAALRAVRLDVLGRLGEEASALKVKFILIAGDTFDAEAPPAKLVQRALSAMADFPDILWILMPGNHDSLAAVDLWERVEREKPDNVILALTPDVIEIGDDVAILPSPPTQRNPGLDLTEWMTAAQTNERFRIGLAHGGVLDFGSEEEAGAIIPPDRAERSNLDYLAIGDWHGQMSITARSWYSGSPEADSFKGHAKAGALLVDIPNPGDVPTVKPLPIGQFDWHAITLDFFAGTDPVQQLIDALPTSGRDKTLVHFEAIGRLGLLEQSQLKDACNEISDDFHFFQEVLDKLSIEQAVDDLDLIATGGALRAAADSLFDATDLSGRTPEDVQIAQIALTHLFHIAQKEDVK
jgi:DNA repair exonuclease SbcCD nuclease subunit|tara:strand:- start:12823 stop:13941 length:1119 start_codon:yes stop_codon:yes gene_type:complete